MKQMKQWVIAATLLFCGMSVMTSCKDCKECKGCKECKECKVSNDCKDSKECKTDSCVATKVESTELIRTSQSWDGVELPDYLKGRPELVAVKYVFPAGQKLGWHHHPVMNYGVLVQGELTIIGLDGKEKVVHEGEPVVEMVGTIHHGENRGKKDVILYMFYLSQKDMPLAVQHPEIKQ